MAICAFFILSSCPVSIASISALCYTKIEIAARQGRKNPRDGVKFMHMIDLIEKKRDGGELSGEEIAFLIDGYTRGEIPDYQVSAFLMAVYFRGMSIRETTDMTLAMVRSGDTLDLSQVRGITADKHSTGGVGDKTSLILCPMVAALGVRMAKMSGRGLGHTGGTIDKLESIPGFSTGLSLKHFLRQVDQVGFAIAGQTADLDPADKKLYALRDVTGTVAIKACIVSSIMSKKLAAGADVIVLDVKTGSGAFMDTEEDAFDLARQMVDVGCAAGKKTLALVTDMDQPLGSAIGNALEVREAIATLRGEFGGDLLELCLELGACILVGAGRCADQETGRALLRSVIADGRALAKFREFVAAQGGDPAVADNTDLLPQAPVQIELPSPSDGYVHAIAANQVGRVCTLLGGGRLTKEDRIDLSVGLLLKKKVGDYVRADESLAVIHAADMISAREAAHQLTACYRIDSDPVPIPSLIKGLVR